MPAKVWYSRRTLNRLRRIARESRQGYTVPVYVTRGDTVVREERFALKKPFQASTSQAVGKPLVSDSVKIASKCKNHSPLPKLLNSQKNAFIPVSSAFHQTQKPKRKKKRSK